MELERVPGATRFPVVTIPTVATIPKANAAASITPNVATFRFLFIKRCR